MAAKRASTPFKFTLQRKSPISPEQQLVAHLKIAMMLGDLQPGEKLPSVRQIEQETGVGRNIVWRAYTKLAESGALTIESRRRAVVNSNFHAKQAAELVKVFDWLSQDVLARVRALRISPQSFQRFLSHRMQELNLPALDIVFVECNMTQARLWSEQVSKLWDLNVPGLDIKAVRSLTEEERMAFKTVLTPLYHHEEVLEIFRNLYTRVIPLRLEWNEESIKRWRALPSDSAFAIVLAKSECLAYGEPFSRELNALCPNLRVQVVPYRNCLETKRLLRSGRYAQALLSGTVLEAVDDEVRASPRVAKSALRIEKRSLEEARLQAGVVL